MTVHQPDPLARLLVELLDASSFDDAARVILQHTFDCAQTALEHTRHEYARKGQLLRAVIHWRPTDTYQRIVCIDQHRTLCSEAPKYLTSATLWRCLVNHRASVSADLALGLLTIWAEDKPIQVSEVSQDSGLLSQETREHLLGRDTTHVHAIPLRTPGGQITGLITLEARCQAALGREFIWSECHQALTLLANIGSPYLAGLPNRMTPSARVDELLPVVGSATAALMEVLRVFASQEETILISGPTGAGKSRLARWCHEHSPRRTEPFETLDLMSIPEDLQMAELFGWKRGAFTGAVKDKPGAVARAMGGTLFIDEIDKLSLKAQAGLLHVLEERLYRPLGDDGVEREADVRFVVGTNTDLHVAVSEGRFREDLFFRINILPVRLPSLAERRDEIAAWADFMLDRRHRESFEEGVAHLAPDAVKLLINAPWPGNLRQLDNIIRRAYAMALAGRAAPEANPIIEALHIERALAHETPLSVANTLAPMWQAAHAFVRECVRRAQRGDAFSLDLSDAYRGLVLAAAIIQLGGSEEALAMFGLEQLFKNRNQKRTLRREMARVRKLVGILQEPLDAKLSAILYEIENSSESSGR